MSEDKSSNWGGKRENSGRKSQLPEKRLKKGLYAFAASWDAFDAYADANDLTRSEAFEKLVSQAS